jgi:hypothetical protein
MNDTDAEARRLLAAATEDMPPGINLLDGFAVARRRDRARRTRRGAVLSAGIATAAASVTAVTLTIGSAPPALAAVTSAMTRTLAQSYHLTEQTSGYNIRNGRIRPAPGSNFTCTIEADPVRHLQASSCANGLEKREVVGRYTYIYGSPAQGWVRTGWMRIPTASLPWSNFMTATPQQMLAEIKKVYKVSVAGPASGPGWTGTRYAFSVALPTRQSGTVTVDQQGRVRTLALTTWGGNGTSLGTQVLTFSDFGAPVTVTPPPANQILSSS